jgi:uncharacterized membrane protein YdfJ with MMPL/SSD domain
MTPDVLLGLIVGAALGAANAVASYLLYRRARTRPSKAFYKLVLGGMGVRMAVVLVTVALVVGLAPVDVSAFIGALLAAFVIGLAIDIVLIARRPVPSDA